MNRMRSDRRVLSAILLVSACIFSAGCNASKTKAAAENAAARFHTQLDAEAYQQILAEATPEFRNSDSQANLQQFFAAIHRKLGKLQRCDETGFYLNFNTSGSTVTLTYESNFASGPATEQFIWRTGDPPRLFNYRIDSRALIVK
jgi:hypothetical protein